MGEKTVLLRDREEEEGRTEESSDKLRRRAPRNPGGERDRVAERGDVHRETECW